MRATIQCWSNCADTSCLRAGSLNFTEQVVKEKRLDRKELGGLLQLQADGERVDHAAIASMS